MGVVVAYSLVNRSTTTAQTSDTFICFFYSLKFKTLTPRASFMSVRRWVEEALEHAGPTRPSLAIVGCKLDLVEVGVDELVG